MNSFVGKIALFAIIFLFPPFFVLATSGACSYHGGVDCDRGWQSDGRVYCNDGWKDSSAYYDFTKKCEEKSNCPSYWPEKEYNAIKKEIEDRLAKLKSDIKIDCYDYFSSDQEGNNNLYQLCLKSNQSLETYAMRMGNREALIEGGILKIVDCEAEKTKRTERNQIKKAACEEKLLLFDYGDMIRGYESMLRCLELDTTDYCSKHIKNSYSKVLGSLDMGDNCVCKNNYTWNKEKTACITYTEVCQNKYGYLSYGNQDNCYCKEGFEFNTIKTECVIKEKKIEKLTTTTKPIIEKKINIINNPKISESNRDEEKVGLEKSIKKTVSADKTTQITLEMLPQKDSMTAQVSSPITVGQKEAELQNQGKENTIRIFNTIKNIFKRVFLFWK